MAQERIASRFCKAQMLAIGVGLLLSLSRVSAAVELVDQASSGAAGFPLVYGQKAASIILPANAPNVVVIAAKNLAEDIAAIAGVKPEVLLSEPTDRSLPRVALVLAPSDLKARWEAYRIKAQPGLLTIEGSDPRGLAFGIYEISRRIGVSPWHWWADVPVARRANLVLSVGEEAIDEPAVRYRGIFLNDEDWGLVPWASQTFEPEVGNLGPRTYAKIFELLLRLRANTIWPAMHPGTTPFFQVPGNAKTADDYAIVVGSSHAEPMLRNNIGEWTAPKEDFNYLTHRSAVLAYWEERVKQRTGGDNLFTLGMRGIHDSPIIGPKSQPERIATLEKIFEDQRNLLNTYFGKDNGRKAGQIFVPYKEVLDDYNGGLRVPSDVTIIWPDDNFGYIRRYATKAERERPGGLGVYYHLSYLGAPLSWLWFDSMSPALIWSEMMRAYEHGARTIWIANVGDLKANELATEFFLDLAWHANRTSLEEPARFFRSAAARDFGPERSEKIGQLLSRSRALAFSRKPEHLQWNFPKDPYAPTTLTETEIARRLDDYKALVSDAEAVAATLPKNQLDAFFELVGYPIAAAAAANEHYFRAEQARISKAKGDFQGAANLFKKSEDAGRQMTALTKQYNDDVAGGKWKNIIMVNGLAANQWKSYQPDPLPPLESSAQSAVRAPEQVKEPKQLEAPVGTHAGDFAEQEGIISINAGDFEGHSESSSGAAWKSIPGLGRTGSAVTVLPSTATVESQTAPRVSYRFFVKSESSGTIRVRLLPTHPIVAGKGLRFALALDGGAPLQGSVEKGFDPKSDEWKRRVLENATEAEIKLPKTLTPGWHTLELIAVDAGVVVDKFVIDLGGLKPSYDGPPETRLK